MKKLFINLSLIITMGCLLSLDANAKVHTILVKDNAFTPNSLTVCLGDTVRFAYEVNALDTHLVHITAPIDSVSDTLTVFGNKFDYTPTSQGTFSYKCDYNSGMTGSFKVISIPIVNLGPDTVQCSGSIVLDAGSSGLTYDWSTLATTQTISVSISGTYWVNVYNSCGTNIDYIDVTIHALPAVNLGSDVTQCGGNILLDAGNPGSTFLWSTAATTQTVSVSATGTYIVVVTDTNGCSASDTAKTFLDGGNPPISVGMESPAFPPAGWTRTNPDNSITWSRTTLASRSGVASMYMDNHSYSTVGQMDEIISPAINLFGGSANAILTFSVAYQLFTNPSSSPNYSDTLRVMISSDCGSTWNTLYNKFGTALTTATPVYSTSPFIPTGNQWRLETIALPMVSQVMIKFVNTTGYENQLYIDDIYINNGVGVNDIKLDNYVTVFPNPSTGTVFVDLNAFDLGNVEMKVYNVLGEVISETAGSFTAPSRTMLDISNQPNGIFFLEVRSENEKTVKKIILDK